MIFRTELTLGTSQPVDTTRTKRASRFDSKGAERKWLKCTDAIEQHMIYLATERGLSESYQLSTWRILEDLAGWILKQEGLKRTARQFRSLSDGRAIAAGQEFIW